MTRMTRSERIAMVACYAITGVLGWIAVAPAHFAHFLMGCLP